MVESSVSVAFIAIMEKKPYQILFGALEVIIKDGINLGSRDWKDIDINIFDTKVECGGKCQEAKKDK